MKDSQLRGLYKLSVRQRIEALQAAGFLEEADATALKRGQSLLNPATADRMTENVVGIFSLPFSVATNFLINGIDYLVPMVVEEPSIVAGVSSAARLFRISGGIHTASTEPLLIGQIQVVDVAEPDGAVQNLLKAEPKLLEAANALQPRMQARGGGAKSFEYFKYQLPSGEWTVVLHMLVDTCDAMGANVVNTMCEGIASQVATLTGGRVLLRILSNYSSKSLVRVTASIPDSLLAVKGWSGEAVRDDIVRANQFAQIDPHRAVTHNKGIMNGVDALAIATGNDWRAIEAGVHAFAARSGRYKALTEWRKDTEGNLVGEMILPLKVGTVGGSLAANPAARLGLALSGVNNARQLGELMAAVGLAQNFAALKALVTHGIQKGHMHLHARSVVSAAGIPERDAKDVIRLLRRSGDITTSNAKILHEQLQQKIATESSSGKRVSASAPAKVILLGEHAAVYGKHAIAIPVPRAVEVEVRERAKGILLRAPDWEIEEEWQAADAELNGAAAVVQCIVEALNVSSEGFDIAVKSRVPLAMGLGSSAAFAVAVIRGICRFCNIEMDAAATDQLAFRCEELVHGTPSGIDNTVASFGEPILYRREGRIVIKPLELPADLPFVIASSGERASTHNILRGVKQRYEENQALYDTIFSEIDELSVAGAVALANEHYAQFGSFMNVCHGFLNALGVSTPALEHMVNIARNAGALGAKLTGSGGGGAIVALCPGRELEVSEALQSAGYDIIPIQPEVG